VTISQNTCMQETLNKGSKPSAANFLEVDIDAWPSVLDLCPGGSQTPSEGNRLNEDKPRAIRPHHHQAIMTISQNLWRVAHMPRSLQVRSPHSALLCDAKSHVLWYFGVPPCQMWCISFT
jgi:hypothetical protein